MQEGRRMVPLGGRSPEDVLPRTMRRLCLFRYQCGMCGREHEAPLYISTSSRTRDEYEREIEKIMQDGKNLGTLLAGHAEEFHEQRGDLGKVVRRMQRRGPFPVTRALSVTITEESKYTCDNCGRTFGSNRKLTRHVERAECR